MNDDPKRQTGRTTRMLAEARRLRDDGRVVYVVCHTMQYGRVLGRDPINEGIRFETLDSLRTLDLQTGRLVGAHPKCVVLMDHHVMEDRFGWALRQATAFDEVTR